MVEDEERAEKRLCALASPSGREIVWGVEPSASPCKGGVEADSDKDGEMVAAAGK